MSVIGKRFIGLACLAMSGDAMAYCGPLERSVVAEFARSDVVVRGTVLSAEADVQQEDGFDFIQGTRYRIRIDESFKGGLHGEVQTYDENDSGRFTLEPGRKYVLYLGKFKPGFDVADTCGNSGDLSDHEGQLAELRRLRASPPPHVSLARAEQGLRLLSTEEEDGHWSFSLLPPGSSVRSKVGASDGRYRIEDVPALKERLKALPRGKYVVWNTRFLEARYPPPALIEEVGAFIRSQGLHLVVID